MDDLDRELKLIQLQRERLALEREMAFQGIGGAVKKVFQSIGRFIAASCRAGGRFFKRWWKGMFTLIFLAGCIGAAVAWRTHQLELEHISAMEIWAADANKYAKQQCPEYERACSRSTIDCLVASRVENSCQGTAFSNYQNQVPRPTPP